jgi:hypothetical protein
MQREMVKLTRVRSQEAPGKDIAALSTRMRFKLTPSIPGNRLNGPTELELGFIFSGSLFPAADRQS